ncbi:MAG: MarR family transcriptional regulator [Deltaproteobacteria bacterium]|nr:MarR family transcriptional regulator [Deltaproteobacteria bacterium]
MPSEADIAHEVLRAIRQIVRRISEHSKLLSRDVGLTVPQLMCLKAIGELEERGEEITVAQVGNQVHLSPATTSRILDRLVRSELITRTRQEKDRRKVCLALTAAGAERYQTLPIPLQESFVERLLALEPEERLELLDALRRISGLMDATELDAAPLLTPGSDVRA